MTLRDEIDADAEGVFLNEDDFAESITHWPAGNSGAAAVVTAIVFLDDTEKVTESGKKFATKGTIHVSSGTTLTHDDVWVINSVNYQTIAVSTPQGGLTEIEIKHVQKKHTTLNRRTEY